MHKWRFWTGSARRAVQIVAGSAQRSKSRPRSDGPAPSCRVRGGANEHGARLEITRMCAAHLKVPALTRLLRPLTFSSTNQNGYSCRRQNGWKRVRLACARLLARMSRRNSGTIGNGSSRIASPRWPSSSSISCSPNEERSGVLLSGDKLALAVTPHFFNLIERDNPDCPIRRQVIPRIEETWTSPYDMADPCGEDSHMPVPGLGASLSGSRAVSGDGSLRELLPLLHAQPRRQRRRRTGIAHRIRGSVSIISKNTPKCATCFSPAATRCSSATTSWRKF